MNRIALRMLMGDARNFLILVGSVAFAALLISDQSAVFWCVMLRTVSQIRDVHADGIWVMDPHLAYVDEVRPLSDTALQRVRAVRGVAWATRLYKGTSQARTETGNYRQVILLGLDEPQLVGKPGKLILGSADSLRKPDAILIDLAGHEYLWPGEPLRLGRELELNDHRAVVVGICDTSPPFQTLPVVYTTFKQAPRYGTQDRRYTSFLLAQVEPGLCEQSVCTEVAKQTDLLALSGWQFVRRTIAYYFRETGIPLNFMVVVGIGVVVGIAICGQTFYLFTSDHISQFAVFKALQASNRQLMVMVLLQAGVVGWIGYGLGVGGTVLLNEVLTRNVVHLRGFFLPWQVFVGTGAAIMLIMGVASVISVRRVMKVEPALIFRNG